MPKRIIPGIEGYTKIQVVSFMRMKLKTDPEWAKRACLSLYEQQTDKEKRLHISTGHNQCGFGRWDAPILTHIACKLRKKQAVLDDINMLQYRMPRYAAQMVCIAWAKDNCESLKSHLNQYYHKKNLPF